MSLQEALTYVRTNVKQIVEHTQAGNKLAEAVCIAWLIYDGAASEDPIPAVINHHMYLSIAVQRYADSLSVK